MKLLTSFAGAAIAAATILLQPTMAGATTMLSVGTSTISGDPGQTIGWGFSLTNTTDYVVLNDSSLTFATPLGTYTDFIASQFIVAGPVPESTIVTETFSSTGLTGLGSFTLNAGSIPGLSLMDTIRVDYSLFSEDPSSPSFDPNSFISSGTLSADVTVDVNPLAGGVPEPATWAMFLVGFGAIGFMMRVLRNRGAIAAA